MSPFSLSDGHEAPGLACELIPSAARVIGDTHLRKTRFESQLLRMNSQTFSTGVEFGPSSWLRLHCPRAGPFYARAAPPLARFNLPSLRHAGWDNGIAIPRQSHALIDSLSIFVPMLLRSGGKTMTGALN